MFSTQGRNVDIGPEAGPVESRRLEERGDVRTWHRFRLRETAVLSIAHHHVNILGELAPFDRRCNPSVDPERPPDRHSRDGRPLVDAIDRTITMRHRLQGVTWHLVLKAVG